MTYRYRMVGGVVKREILVPGNRRRVRGEDRPQHFSRTLLNAYYQLECEHGCRFRSNYAKDRIKRVHDTAIERFEQTGVEA
jgi:hypothetical protein